MYVCYFIFHFISVDLFKYYTLGFFFSFFHSFSFFPFFTFPFKTTGLQASVYQAPEQPNWIFLLALAVFIFYSRLIPLQRARSEFLGSAPEQSQLNGIGQSNVQANKSLISRVIMWLAPELWSLRSFAPKFRPEMNCRRLWYFGSRGSIMLENNADARAVCSGAGARVDNKRRRWCDGSADKGRRASGSLSEGRRRQADRQTDRSLGRQLMSLATWHLWDKMSQDEPRGRISDAALHLFSLSVFPLCVGAEGEIQSPTRDVEGSQQGPCSHSPETAVQKWI